MLSPHLSILIFLSTNWVFVNLLRAEAYRQLKFCHPVDPQPAVQIIDLDVEDSEHVPIDVIAGGTRTSIRAWPGPLDRIAARVAGGLAGEGSTLDGRAVAGLWLCATRADGADTAKWGWRHRKPHSAGGIYPLFAASLCASGAPIILCRTVPTVQATAHRTPPDRVHGTDVAKQRWQHRVPRTGPPWVQCGDGATCRTGLDGWRSGRSSDWRQRRADWRCGQTVSRRGSEDAGDSGCFFILIFCAGPTLK